MKFPTQISTLLALLTAVSAYPTDPPNTITPENISIYHGYGGRIEYDVPYGKIERKQSGNDDISTLLTFSFPESTGGRTCTFNFALSSSSYTYTGSAFIDAFFSSQYATGNSAGWGPPSNYRDGQLGRLRLVRGGQATVEWGSFAFACPAGETRGFEVTPTGDNISVVWEEASEDGAWISWS